MSELSVPSIGQICAVAGTQLLGSDWPEISGRAEALLASREADVRDGYRATGGGVAVIEISGFMSRFRLGRRPSTDDLTAAVRAAAADPAVRSILLLVNSGGGFVFGTSELSDAVFESRAAKPVVTYAEDACASAAYHVGCQAHYMVGNTLAHLGSIGTYAAHLDVSKRFELEGLRLVVVRKGEHKGRLLFGQEVRPEDEAEEERLLGYINDQFLAAIERGRGFSRKQAEALNTGQMWIGAEAVALGLLDEIAPFEDVLARLAEGWAPGPRRAGSPTTDNGGTSMPDDPSPQQETPNETSAAAELRRLEEAAQAAHERRQAEANATIERLARQRVATDLAAVQAAAPGDIPPAAYRQLRPILEHLAVAPAEIEVDGKNRAAYDVGIEYLSGLPRIMGLADDAAADDGSDPIVAGEGKGTKVDADVANVLAGAGIDESRMAELRAKFGDRVDGAGSGSGEVTN